MPSIPRSTLVPYAIAAALVLALGGRWLAGRPGGSASDGAAPAAAAAPPGAEILRSGREKGRVVVHVAGSVRRPGVYRLRHDARVRDAVLRAGGATSRAQTAGVNLAAKLADGQQVIVPERPPPTPAGPRGAPAPGPETAASPGPVSLNTATLEQLDALQGIGPATAQKILEWRRTRGGFASVDDLGEVPGIGPKKLEALRPQVSP